MTFRRIALLVALVASLAGVAADDASASRNLIKGIYDEPETLYGNPDWTFPILARLGTRAIRVNLYWGGKFGASKARPTYADPDEPGKFDWRIYDRLVHYASQYKIRVIFSIYGTPSWANGGRGLNVPPTNYTDLRRFAYIAAYRYSGRYIANDGRVLPAVKYWVAWNEPNNPVFLRQQYRRVGGRWVIQSAIDYAKICNSIFLGIRGVHHLSGEEIACGATSPRGNNAPRSSRPSVSPLAFLRAFKAAGAARAIDAYAHHPYYGSAAQEPGKAPPPVRGAAATAVTLGNINTLIAEVTRFFGRKKIWITEYGYQTNPPDRIFGVSYVQQARYLTQAFAIARANPRITMMLWFLLKDEPQLNRWQSGLMTNRGARKPAFDAFRRVRSVPAVVSRAPRSGR